MATLYSNQKTKWSQNVPSEKIDTNELGGRVRVAFADITLASAAIADVVQMVNLPNGARIIDGYLTNAALGASTTLSVGYAAHKNAAGTTVALSSSFALLLALAISATLLITSGVGNFSLTTINI